MEKMKVAQLAAYLEKQMVVTKVLNLVAQLAAYLEKQMVVMKVLKLVESKALQWAKHSAG